MLGPLQEAQKRQEILDKGTVKFLKTFEVIGMTITGAATRLHLLGMCINKSIENGTIIAKHIKCAKYTGCPKKNYTLFDFL